MWLSFYCDVHAISRVRVICLSGAATEGCHGIWALRTQRRGSLAASSVRLVEGVDESAFFCVLTSSYCVLTRVVVDSAFFCVRTHQFSLCSEASGHRLLAWKARSSVFLLSSY